SETLRAAMFALFVSPSLMFLAQLLDGVTGSIILILTTLVVADLTAGTGRFNLAQGMVGTLTATAAAASTAVMGSIAYHLGDRVGFLTLTCASAIALVTSWLAFAESKPDKYDD